VEVRASAVILVLALVAGCSGSDAGETTTTVPELSTTTSSLGSADVAGLIDTSKPWDLVWFSDSTGWGVADLWAERISEEFGVEVRVHDHASSVLPAVEVLHSLGLTRLGDETDSFGRFGDLRDEISEAEIVVVYGNPIDSGSTEDLQQCVTTSRTPREPPVHFSDADFEPYQSVFESIFEQILALTGDRPIIVRAIDSYNPVIADQEAAGVKGECVEAWEAWSASIGRAAAAYGVRMVSMYDAFNGLDHTEDPREKGYITGDGQHATPEGQRVLATAMHQAGYETTTSP
jgi:hypothetical protein